MRAPGYRRLSPTYRSRSQFLFPASVPLSNPDGQMSFNSDLSRGRKAGYLGTHSYSCIKYEDIPGAQILPVFPSYGHFLCQPAFIIHTNSSQSLSNTNPTTAVLKLLCIVNNWPNNCLMVYSAVTMIRYVSLSRFNNLILFDDLS